MLLTANEGRTALDCSTFSIDGIRDLINSTEELLSARSYRSAARNV